MLHNQVVTLDTNGVALLLHISLRHSDDIKASKNRQTDILLIYAHHLCCMEVQSLSTGCELTHENSKTLPQPCYCDKTKKKE